MSTYRVVVGIISALKQYYGNNALVFIDDLPQKFTRPCFWIDVVKFSSQRAINDHFNVSHLIDVKMYATNKDKPHQELYDAQDILTDILEVVPYKDDSGEHQIRGTAINAVITDGVLHFMIEYAFDVYVPKNIPLMKYLKTEINLQK